MTVFLLPLVACDCDDEPTGGVLPDSGSADSGIDGGAGATVDAGEAPDAGTPVPQRAELWYSVDDLLVHISLNPDDGTVDDLEAHPMLVDLPAGQNSLTMLADGSLLGARLSAADDQTYFYYIARVPEPGEDVDPATLGVMPDGADAGGALQRLRRSPVRDGYRGRQQLLSGQSPDSIHRRRDRGGLFVRRW